MALMNSGNQCESIHFVTGKLAEPALREIVASIANKLGFEYSIEVLPITVAALMTPQWLLKHMRVPEAATRVILPGYLQSGIEEIRSAVSKPIACGPKDVRDLPISFGRKRFIGDDYGRFSIEIIAEINYASRPHFCFVDVVHIRCDFVVFCSGQRIWCRPDR